MVAQEKTERYSWQSISCNMTELLAKANHMGTLPGLRAKGRNNFRYCWASWDRNSAHTTTSTTALQHPHLPRNPHLGSEVQFYKYPWIEMFQWPTTKFLGTVRLPFSSFILSFPLFLFLPRPGILVALMFQQFWTPSCLSSSSSQLNTGLFMFNDRSK